MEMSRRICLLMLIITTIEASIYTNKIYKWTKNPESHATTGKNLLNHKYKTIYMKFSPVQCAYECLKDSKCKSFSHEKVIKFCELHNSTHVDAPASFVDDIERDYHTRSAYSIDPEALGPCGMDACSNHGKCLETRTTDDNLVAICVCDAGWSGVDCETEDPVPTWGPWKSWEACSVTCGKGWKKRTRNCEDAVLKTSLPVDQCFGDLADTEYQGCTMTDCPRWEEWGDWGECSTQTSCGRGFKVRNRTCSNGGTAGIDRYCLGDFTQSAPCMDMNCKSALRIRGGSEHGEGRVEIYNDIKKEWGLICANQWDQSKADLICKQVGLPAAHLAITDGRFGNGDGQYGITDINCEGDERTLQMCQRNLWSLTSTCTGDKAAGVQCQVNGVWSLWGEWSECSVTCEDGTRTRTRLCNHPPALHGGRACIGDDLQTKPCTLPACPTV
ncbi:A disintegrin and metalloproteinase with thrombospondin motifs adt-2 isoform X2 [Patella vulgata]|uniref:A disintegrin and metalloproteinase with thrombospondin motifs adt-2 isoform X2 n=1 Tax=Patella vulgata TaxID=6465 RepID=UPI00217F9D0E|nr:A disintegrin and metalloproteinase with thrombospondin motifs adt-2 isoform X2 [Patella vulgata]